ncbi:MAG: hypothetical protein ACI9DK_000526 [Vicingaceae bacterium]|jgi:hypothetical protein
MFVLQSINSTIDSSGMVTEISVFKGNYFFNSLFINLECPVKRTARNAIPLNWFLLLSTTISVIFLIHYKDEDVAVGTASLKAVDYKL